MSQSPYSNLRESFVAPQPATDLNQRIRQMEKDRQTLTDGKSRLPLPMVDHTIQTNRDHQLADELLQWQQHTTLLAKVFFHPKNVNTIQNLIRRMVFDQSQGKFLISRQNDIELVAVMRSMYLQFARHQEDNITEQVEELNRLVANEVVPPIIKSVESHLTFVSTLHQLPAPMALPQSSNQRGDKIYGQTGQTNDMFKHMSMGTVGRGM